MTSTSPPRQLSASEFFELPLSVRIEHVIARSASFFLRGREVDRTQALAELRKARARSS